MTAWSIFQSMKAPSNRSPWCLFISERFWIKYAESWDASREVTEEAKFWFLRGPCVGRLRWLTRYLSLIRANLISGRVISHFSDWTPKSVWRLLLRAERILVDVLFVETAKSQRNSFSFQALLCDKKIKIKLVSGVSKMNSYLYNSSNEWEKAPNMHRPWSNKKPRSS